MLEILTKDMDQPKTMQLQTLFASNFAANFLLKII